MDAGHRHHDPVVVPGEVPGRGQVRRRAGRPASTADRCRRPSSPHRVQPDAAQRVVDGVGHHDVVAHLGAYVGGQQQQALRLAERAAAGAPSTRPRVPTRCGAAPSRRRRPARRASGDRSRRPAGCRRAGRSPCRGSAASVAGGGGATYGPSPRCRVPFASCSRTRSSSSTSSACRAPRRTAARRRTPRGRRRPASARRARRTASHVVSSGSSSTGWSHVVALDRGGHRVRVGLVRELRRVHADDDEHVGVRSSSGRSSSRTCRQLTQQNVQKSSSTILPRRSARVRSRPPVLSQARPCQLRRPNPRSPAGVGGGHRHHSPTAYAGPRAAAVRELHPTGGCGRRPSPSRPTARRCRDRRAVGRCPIPPSTLSAPRPAESRSIPRTAADVVVAGPRAHPVGTRAAEEDVPVDPVHAAPELVVPGATVVLVTRLVGDGLQAVIAGTTVDAVLADAAVDLVIAALAAHQVHARVAVQDVAVPAAQEDVVAVAGADDIVAAACMDHVAPVEPHDDVRPLGADDLLAARRPHDRRRLPLTDRGVGRDRGRGQPEQEQRYGEQGDGPAEPVGDGHKRQGRPGAVPGSTLAPKRDLTGTENRFTVSVQRTTHRPDQEVQIMLNSPLGLLQSTTDEVNSARPNAPSSTSRAGSPRPGAAARPSPACSSAPPPRSRPRSTHPPDERSTRRPVHAARPA